MLSLVTGVRTEAARALRWDCLSVLWRHWKPHQEGQGKERQRAAEVWQDTGLVFTTTTGGPLDAANVRRSFRRICKAANIGENSTPRELRHSFVSITSDSGVPIERIADMA